MSWYIESSESPLMPKQMVEVDVKPCPFCGSNKRLTISRKDHFENLVAKNGSSMISIICKNCDLEFKDYDIDDCNDYEFLRSRLVKRWNDRKENDNADKED